MEFQASLALVAPELVLSLSGLALLLAAAWGGDKASRLISILAVAALVGAGFLAAPALCNGASGPDTLAFGGQVKVDAFAAGLGGNQKAGPTCVEIFSSSVA